jgi:hypothetical protein
LIPIHFPHTIRNLKQRLLFFTLDFRSNTSIEDSDGNDAVPEPVVDLAEHLDVPQSKEVALDKDLRIVSFH